MKYLLILMLFGPTALARGVNFVDIESSHYKSYIEELASTGMVKGYEDRMFRPDAPINRAEFLKILLEAKYQTQVGVTRLSKNNCFSDLPITEAWFKVYACVAKNRGIISGYDDGTFRAAGTVNKAEAAKILTNVYFGTELSRSTPWYDHYYKRLEQEGILFDFFEATPDTLLTRGEMAFAISQLELYPAHVISPQLNIAVLPAQNKSTKDSEPPSKEAVPEVKVWPEATRLDISPLRVIDQNPPGPQVQGGYISTYAQWVRARYQPDLNNNQLKPTQIVDWRPKILASVNEKLVFHGFNPLREDPELSALAQNFTEHLVINALYSHSDAYGQDPFDRAKLAGIEGFVAESIVWRNQNPLKAIDWWRNSPVHWKNISNPRFKRGGIGIVQEPSGGYIIVLFQGE